MFSVDLLPGIFSHCNVASSNLLILLSSTLWAVFDTTDLPPIAAIIFSITSWLYLVPWRLLITLASCSKLVDTNPAGKLILISSTIPSCTSKIKFSRCVLPSWAGTSSVRETVNFGVLPKFQSQERNSLVNLSIPAILIYNNIDRLLNYQIISHISIIICYFTSLNSIS